MPQFRICHVQLFPLLSGVQRSMLEIFRHLDRSRYEIHVACKERGPLTERLAELEIPVHYVPDFAREVHPVRDVRAYRQLRRIFAEQNFQLVHTHSSKPGILGRLAARSAGVPVVIHHVRGFAFHEFSPRRKRWLYGGVERQAARLCDRLLFVNCEERDLVVRQGWMPAEKCQTVYNGVDLARVHPAHRHRQRAVHRAAWGVSDAEFIALFVGRLEYPKQPLLVAEIAARLEKLRPLGAWRILVAGSGPGEAALAESIRAHGLEHRVNLLGWQRDPEAAVQAADAVLLPSLHEGLPRALIEAQAAGLPIVASRAKGNREVVVSGTGLLCSPKDANSYATALAQLIDSPALCARFGLAGRRHAEQCFDTRANNQQIVDVYESLLAERCPALAAA